MLRNIEHKDSYKSLITITNTRIIVNHKIYITGESLRSTSIRKDVENHGI